MDPLKNIITKHVLTRSVNADNLMEAAKVSEDNIHMEEFSNSLVGICSDFVLANPFKLLKMFSNIDPEDGNEKQFTLNKVISKVFSKKDFPSDDCRNCKHDPCLDGEQVTNENFVVNAAILPENNPNVEDPPLIRRTLKLERFSDLHYTKDIEVLKRSLIENKFVFKCYVK